MNAKIAIDKALFRLLGKRSLNKITIINICEEAKVNRQSFYYYYRDIIHILKEVIFQDIHSEIKRGSSYDSWEYGFITLMNYLKSNRTIFMNIYHSTYWSEINDFFADCANTLLKDVVDECESMADLSIPTQKKIFIINFYRIVFVGIMTEWIVRGASPDPLEVLEDLQKLICGTIPNALKQFQE